MLKSKNKKEEYYKFSFIIQKGGKVKRCFVIDKDIISAIRIILKIEDSKLSCITMVKKESLKEEFLKYYRKEETLN